MHALTSSTLDTTNANKDEMESWIEVQKWNKWKENHVAAGQLRALFICSTALYYNNIHEIPCKWTFVGLIGVHVTCTLVGSGWSGYVHSLHVAPPVIVK